MGINIGAGGNVIAGNYIGTDATGTTAAANGCGVEIYSSASNNTIGGTTAAARNVISGNSGYGVYISGAAASGNVIEGNYIGTNATGTASVANATGVFIDGASSNAVGGTAAGAQNVISGNSSYGVSISGSTASGNVVEGNCIGTNATGTAAVANYIGVKLTNAPNNTIGGTTAGAKNVISGNSSEGVYITGLTASWNAVEGNYIGTNAAGTAVVGNNYGISLWGSNNMIGGTTAGAQNLISGNWSYGVRILGSTASGNVVEGNYIGTDATGTAAVANGNGVYISAAPNNTIGGTTAEARNVISGNTQYGVSLVESTASGNVIEGNYIGTDATGTAAVANGGGVFISSASNNTIGGTTAGAKCHLGKFARR